MKKSVKILLAVSPLVLFQHVAHSQTLVRGYFKVHLDEQQSSADKDNSIEETALNVLKYNNIYVDEKSKIQIHNDGSSVDLNCFNCLIQRVGPEIYEHSPDNKEVFVP